MCVSVVNIRKMRMLVRHGDMTMPVLMRLVIVPIEIVKMLMVFVVDMPMTVFHWLMHVSVLMMLRQVQPDAHAHQARCQPEW